MGCTVSGFNDVTHISQRISTSPYRAPCARARIWCSIHAEELHWPLGAHHHLDFTQSTSLMMREDDQHPGRKMKDSILPPYPGWWEDRKNVFTGRPRCFGFERRAGRAGRRVCGSWRWWCRLGGCSGTCLVSALMFNSLTFQPSWNDYPGQLLISNQQFLWNGSKPAQSFSRVAARLGPIGAWSVL